MDFVRVAHTILVDRRRVKWRDVFVANPGDWNKTKMFRPTAKCTGLGSVASSGFAGMGVICRFLRLTSPEWDPHQSFRRPIGIRGGERGQVSPITVKVLQAKFRIDASGARSKSWEEFWG